MRSLSCPHPISTVFLEEEDIRTQTHRGTNLWGHREGMLSTSQGKKISLLMP